MARKEISTPLDLENMENHNYMNKELYSLIDETDRRISENMWEEIKDANTMKMLKPVQTAADLPHLADLLPSEEADKSLITVIDEQRVYTYFQGKWQPFNQIDLDPFEPFKEELAAIVAAYEKQIQNITTEVQNTKDSAIESIESTQSQISTIRDEMTTQASDLTALFNDHMAQLTSKQDTALAEVDSAKQAAITALEDFNNTDTSNWQKYKLTNDTGDQITNFNGDYPMTNENLLSAKTGFYYNLDYQDAPSGTTGFVYVTENGGGGKKIYYSSYSRNDLYIKSYSSSIGWIDWKKLVSLSPDEKIETQNSAESRTNETIADANRYTDEQLSKQHTVLFEGSASGVGTSIALSDSLTNYNAIIVSGNFPGGRFNESHLLYNNDGMSINKTNIANSDGNNPVNYEIRIEITNQNTLKINNEVKNNLFQSNAGSNSETHFKVERIEGWK